MTPDAIARATLSVLMAVPETTLHLLLRSKDFVALVDAAHAAVPTESHINAAKAKIAEDLDLSAGERTLRALLDEVVAARRSSLSRQELVLLHTLCGARASQIEPFTPSDTAYKAELIALARKLDTLIDGKE